MAALEKQHSRQVSPDSYKNNDFDFTDSYAEGHSPSAGGQQQGLKRGLKNRHIAMISLGGVSKYTITNCEITKKKMLG